jgi:hypothetical protein
MASRTQAHVADDVGGNQAEVSRLDRRTDDVMVSTLRRYAEALGAKCEVVFVFPRGDRFVLKVD